MMFLLYVDKNDQDQSSVNGRQNRDIFFSLFENISDTSIVNSIDEVAKIVADYPQPYNTIVVCFGLTASCRASSDWFILPVLDMIEDEKALMHLTNIVGVLAITTTDRQSIKNMLSCQNGESKDIIGVTWPLWGYDAIERCRRSAPSAIRKIPQDDFDVLYTDIDPSEVNEKRWVTFGASVDNEQQLEQLVGTFFEGLKHNHDAVLFVHWRSAASADSASARDAVYRVMENAENSACKVMVISSEAAKRVLSLPTSFYISLDSGIFSVEAYSHFAAQVPIISSQNLCSELGLSSDYALQTNDEKILSIRLKDAMHIAKTAPEGYHLLRREAAQRARRLFSVESLAKVVRKLLVKQGIRKYLPHADDSLPMEEYITWTVGLRDYLLSGWFDKENHALAPQFPIQRNDIVVDVGCGKGEFSAFAAQYASQLIGCDVDESALEIAKNEIDTSTDCKTIWLQTTGEDLDVETNFADKVICTEVLEHVDDPEKVMSELFRIGKPGSLYLISAPDTLSERLQEPVAPPVYFEKPNHIRIFEREDFKELVKGAGFKIVDYQTRGFYATIEWLLKWFDDPILEHQWAQLWCDMLDRDQGLRTKAVLDQYIAKSQTIVAQKPL